MAYKVIVISREFGSGGRTIGKNLAEQLNIKCYDKQIIKQIAKESGFDDKYVEETSESSKSFFEQIFSQDAFYAGPNNQDDIWFIQCQYIHKIAEGPCVIVGRCADYLLNDRDDVLKVFIHSDIESRAKRIVDVYGESDVDAMTRVKTKDKKRISFYEHYTGLNWGDAYNYHLCLDSGKLGIEKCVSIIKQIYEDSNK